MRCKVLRTGYTGIRVAEEDTEVEYPEDFAYVPAGAKFPSWLEPLEVVEAPRRGRPLKAKDDVLD